jgi:hypothetical protein
VVKAAMEPPVKRMRLAAYHEQQEAAFSQSFNVKPQRFLELQGVIDVLNSYNTFDGSDITCCICGESFFVVWIHYLSFSGGVSSN